MYCPRCGRDDLTAADFGKNSSRPNGLTAYCRACNNRYQREWASKHPDKQRAGELASEQKHREHYRAYYRDYYKRNPDKQKADNDRLRAIREQAFVAPVDAKTLFEQYGWMCQLCGEPVDPNLRWPDLMSATLDHIIPIACGGTHEPSNVQLAHFSCNVRKA